MKRTNLKLSFSRGEENLLSNDLFLLENLVHQVESGEDVTQASSLRRSRIYSEFADQSKVMWKKTLKTPG